MSLLLTDDARIQALNRNYRHKDRATDVLSFSQLEGAVSQIPLRSLGDIVISVETARKQALCAQIPLAEEILRLLIHGILHLLGYEHEKVPLRTAQHMFSVQNFILESLRSDFCPQKIRRR